jgi:hypothetical protein
MKTPPEGLVAEFDEKSGGVISIFQVEIGCNFFRLTRYSFLDLEK